MHFYEIHKMEKVLTKGFSEMSTNEMQEVDGGVAPFIIYGGALLGGWAVGHLIGYFAG